MKGRGSRLSTVRLCRGRLFGIAALLAVGTLGAAQKAAAVAPIYSLRSTEGGNPRSVIVGSDGRF